MITGTGDQAQKKKKSQDPKYPKIPEGANACFHVYNLKDDFLIFSI